LQETSAVAQEQPKEAPVAVAEEPPVFEEAPVAKQTPAPAPRFTDSPAEQPPAESRQIRPAQSGQVPECVAVSLRGLVAALPDNVLAGPRAELWRKTDFDVRVPLPVKPILPQLRSARIQLPLETVLAVMPSCLLANPLPAIDGEMVALPLHEIIPQLPPRLFSSVLRRAGDQQFQLTDVDIPEPFHERMEGSIPSEEPALEDVVPVAPESLDNDDFDVFSEKPVPTELPNIEPFEEPAPVAAEIQPPPPVEEPVAAEAAPETPHEEPVTPALAETQLITPPPELVEATATPEAEVPATPEIPLAAELPVSAETPAPVEIEEHAAVEIQVPAETHEITAETQAPVEAQAPGEIAATEPLHEHAAELAGIDEKKFLIDLNRCTVEDLMNIQGIGPALARRIIEFRDERGHFSSVKDLRHIPGVGRKVFHALAGAQPRALNRLLGVDHNRELSLQEIVHLTAGMPGVDGCMLAMSDGLFVTGKLPPHLDQNAISVFAPQLFKKMGRYVRELKVGQVRRFTIFTDQQPLSVFRAGDVFLIVVHDTRHFSKALLRRCERISEEIARLCRQRAVV
jgi:competence ComEA-like helix-hairpin-helix protein